MTDITVKHNHFDDHEFVRNEIKQLELFGEGKEFEAPPSGGTPIHWHAIGLHVYITEGTFRFRDPATDELHVCVAGTKFVIPERILHIEEPHNGYKGIVGLTKAEFPQPFVRQPEELEEILRKENAEAAAG